MGHKVHPKAHRLQVVYTWDSRWFSHPAEYQKKLQEDIRIREYLGVKFKDAQPDSIKIERSPREMVVTIFAAKPGIIIGRGGQGIEEVRKFIERNIVKMRTKIRLNVQEVKNPLWSANVVMRQVISDLERRIPFRRVMKQTISRVMGSGALGVKISVAGRLNGAEIARRENMSTGKLPLQTLRSDVDYAQSYAHTIFGSVGVKVWIYRGELFKRKDLLEEETA